MAHESQRDPVDLWTSLGTRTAHMWGPHDCLRSSTGPKSVGSLYLKVVPVQQSVTGWMAPLQFKTSANNRACPDSVPCDYPRTLSLRDPYATIEHHVTVKPQDRSREAKSQS